MLYLLRLTTSRAVRAARACARGFHFKYGALYSKADNSWHLTQAHRVMEAPADPRRPSGSTAEAGEEGVRVAAAR